MAEAVAGRQALAGTRPVAELPRLVSALAGPEGQLSAQLQFAPSVVSRGVVTGAVQGTLLLTCQRCLKTFPWALQAAFGWQLVLSEAEEERVMEADQGDPVLLQDGWLLLPEALEDEALLALPLAPVCAEPACQGRFAPPPSPVDAEASEISHNAGLDDSKPNPFAALKGRFPAR